MSATMTKTEVTGAIDGRVLARVLEEGYGPGAWHGPDMKAALEDVTSEMAFRRPAPGRHSIAEIALHHAFCVRSVRGRISGAEPEPFVLPGEDWFPVDGPATLSWTKIRKVVESEQRRLVEAVEGISSGRVASSLSGAERLEAVLGITCHAVYHAGQVQLVKRLVAG